MVYLTKLSLIHNIASTESVVAEYSIGKAVKYTAVT
jgi:hypothetical protein